MKKRKRRMGGRERRKKREGKSEGERKEEKRKRRGDFISGLNLRLQFIFLIDGQWQDYELVGCYIYFSGVGMISLKSLVVVLK